MYISIRETSVELYCTSCDDHHAVAARVENGMADVIDERDEKCPACDSWME